MRKILYIFILQLMVLFSLSACTKPSDTVKINHSVADYTGKYNDYETNEPNLEISKDNDGSYNIQIGIFRLVYLDDCKGRLKNNNIEFIATAPNGKKLNGTIKFKDNIATVKFLTSKWQVYSSVDTYKYYKVK